MADKMKVKVWDGPGKWDLALAILEPGKTVPFTVGTDEKNAHKATVTVTGLELESYPDDRSVVRIQGQSDDPILTEGVCSRIFFTIHSYNLTSRRGEELETNHTE